MQRSTPPQQQGPFEAHIPPRAATRPSRHRGRRPRSSIALTIFGVGTFATPAVITTAGVGSIIALWLVALGALVAGLIVELLLADTPPAPVLVVRAAQTYKADGFFGAPPVRPAQFTTPLPDRPHLDRFNHTTNEAARTR